MRKYAPHDPTDSAQIEAARLAIVREYGRVIGAQQAENIAYIALQAARMAAVITPDKEPS